MAISEFEQNALYAAIGRRIRDLRIQRDLTQSQLASAISLSRTSVTNIEGGRQKLLVHVLVEIARALGVQPSALLFDLHIALEETTDEKALADLDEADRRFVTKIISPGREDDGV